MKRFYRHFDLPVELRIMIYSFVLKTSHPIRIHFNSMRSASANVLPILGTSRLPRAEALPVLYQINRLETKMTIDPGMKQAIPIYITQLPHLQSLQLPALIVCVCKT